MSWVKKQVGDNWYEILSPILKTPEFKKNFEEVNTYYRTEGGFPIESEIFKVFEFTPLKELKAVIVIDNKDFDNFLIQYDLEFPDHFNTGMMDKEYVKLYKQGIMILPLALTSSNKKGPHYKQWQFFGEKLLDSFTGDVLIFEFNTDFSFVQIQDIINKKFKIVLEW